MGKLVSGLLGVERFSGFASLGSRRSGVSTSKDVRCAALVSARALQRLLSATNAREQAKEGATTRTTTIETNNGVAGDADLAK